MSQIYPRYCFHLSPTVNTWCLLRAADIHALDQHADFEGKLSQCENFYFYKNLPIKWVRIVGVVVAVDEFTGRHIYTVDDSSGQTIQAMVKLKVDKPMKMDESDTGGEQDPEAPPDPGPYANIDVGAVVDVKGGVSTFRQSRQVNVEKMALVKTTEQEVALWEKRAKFRRQVLDMPWVLGDRDIRRCRKEAERSDAEAEPRNKQPRTVTRGGKAHQPARLSKSSNSRDRGTAERVQEMIRAGAAKGKYNALGL